MFSEWQVLAKMGSVCACPLSDPVQHTGCGTASMSHPSTKGAAIHGSRCRFGGRCFFLSCIVSCRLLEVRPHMF